ncbi:hypothetical protein GUJ93_ZPchr0002g23759 [Zizania palustris]|uniref:Uncharacterized protein n=2 Tax=Zizania palustris TaxID=103762 RepID=A0A8J5V4L5_ZIZPA|nr:hypothetical protein GUJ93_ZPchr0002g23759 [Zizania palustris]
MAESQVEGMRKAYAEIMLNMAQESAARVLAAERRAAALAGGLVAAREDGVAALVRLKAIMEARIKEVESQSLAHIKKIKELQEQLHGAQDTVTSLQIELHIANTKLEQTRSALSEERKNNIHTCHKINSNKNCSTCSKKHLQDRVSKNKNTVKESEAVESLEKLYNCGSDLGSFMSGNKKPELYRNGCTQRIHALKQQSLSGDSSLVQNNKQASALNSRSKTGKRDTDKNLHSTRSIMEQILQTKFLANCKRKRGRRSRPSYMHDNSGEHGQAEYKSSDASDGNGCLLLLQALEQDLSPLMVSAEHDGEALADQKDDLLMDGKDSSLNLHTASPGLNDILSVSSIRMKRRKRSKTIRVFESGCSEAKSISELGETLPRSTNENNMSNHEDSSDTPPRNSSPVMQCSAENLMCVADAASTGQLKSENSSPRALKSIESEIGDEGNSRGDYLECRTPENNALGLEEVNVEGGRHIKYTFNRRKRKTAPSDSTPQGAVPEKSSSLLCPDDRTEPCAKPEMPHLLTQSPRADNQLIHVAQQLILLAAQK